MALPTSFELLEIQAEGSFDARGRIAGLYGIAIACAGDQHALWVGTDVPEDLATELTAVFAQAARPEDPGEPPLALESCRRILASGGRALYGEAGPSFLFAADTRFHSEVHIECSDMPVGDATRHGNPGNWHPVEWNELLDGSLGPWTMALAGDRVVSICHTPRPITARSAECGVWTAPEFRARGYAAAVTAAWATIMQPSGRHLFYSTDADNHSSRRVVQRLNLRLLGWTWRLSLAPERDPEPVHPLSSLRRGVH
jgi:RimJ/RimL family protein N-acetyltransferase